MKRLTTDDEKSMVYCFNLFYAKDREVWVRGGGPGPEYKDVTLVQWIRSAAQKHGLNFTAENPEYLGDEMCDALQDGNETVEGIVALLHVAAVQATEMRERLKMIEVILGDDYDLDLLRELVEAERGGRAPVVHASWEWVEDFGGDGHWRCTNCGVEWAFNDGGPEENEAHHCPRCGAKMDGGKPDD